MALLALSGLGLLVAAMLPSQGVTKANFDRIEMGMTRDDVALIFGWKGDVSFPPDDKGSVWIDWGGEDRSMAFVLINKGRVIDKHWQPSKLTTEEKVRRRLRIRY